MGEKSSQSAGTELLFDLGNPQDYLNSENPPYNPYIEYLSSWDAAHAKIDMTDFDEPAIDPDLEQLAGGFRVR